LSPTAQRQRLALLCGAFGLLHLAATAFVVMSSLGPVPLKVTARAWSLAYYGHFVSLVVFGYGTLLADGLKWKLFHGGPFIDFTLGVTAFILVSSFGGVLLGRESAPSWPALLPGAFLVALALRLAGGRPLLGSK
jgi:hypothetical protein